MNNNLEIAIGDTWHPKLLPYFAMAMMGLMLITNVLNLKFVNIGGISVIASLITYVLSLILADIMAEVYGYRRVRRLLYVGLCFLVLYAVSLQIAVWMPPANGYQNDSSFHDIFSQAPRIAIASIIAYFVTELTNSYVMSRLKIKYSAKYFLGRAVVSVGSAQIINVVAFFSIAFAGVMSLKGIVQAGSVSWIIVMLCELFVLPVTKKFAWIVKNIEGVEHFDSAPGLKE
jgi:uncharacterized integral membrane protein (TIGR00697 family)